MATNIFKFDGSLLTTVADGALDNTHASIRIPGRGYQNYGEPVMENILWIMENFAGSTSPPLPIAGQLWYDTSAGEGAGVLKVYTGADWATAGGVIASDVAPSNYLTVGAFWYDTLHKQLNTWNGNKWDIVGPLGSGTDALDPTDPVVPDHSVIDAITVIATEDQQPRKLWRITVGGVLLAIISKDPVFTPQSTTFTNNSFQKIYPGLNFNNSIAGVGIAGDQTVFKSTQDNLPNFDSQWNLGSSTKKFKNIYGVNGIFSSGVGINTSPTVNAALNVNGKSSFNNTVTLGAGTVNYPPLKMTKGDSVTSPQLGAIEFDGNNFYFTGLVSGRPTRQTPIFSLSPLQSKSFFVSSTVGDDTNNGLSRTQPFKTIKKALSVASAGTSIFVESGEYLEQNPMYVPPRVSLVGDNLRRVIVRPVHNQLDIFHVDVNSYFFGFTFKDHRSPAFCFAFPCSTAVATINSTTGEVASITPTYTQVSGDLGEIEDQYAIGYTTIPDIYIEAPSTGAAGQAEAVIDFLVDGAVVDVIVTNGGSGYVDDVDLAPTVTFTGGDGNAAGKARVKDGVIVAVDITSYGKNYTYPVEAVFQSGVPGSGATAKVILGKGIITKEAIRFKTGKTGSGYDKNRPPLISIKPPNPATITSSPYVQNCSSITGPFDKNGKLIITDNVTLSLPFNAESLLAAGYTPWVNPDDPTDHDSMIGADPYGAGAGIRVDGQVVSDATVIRSFVADSFTQLNQGGTGHLIINRGYTQFVSCFTTFSSIGYWVRGGGFANISNSVIDFGNIGLKAEGFYPIAYTTGTVQGTYYSKVSAVEVSFAGNDPIPGPKSYAAGPGFSLPSSFYMYFEQGTDAYGVPAKARVDIDINGQVSGIVIVESDPIPAGSFEIGVEYTIATLGTSTDWNAIGVVGTPAVGVTFTATGPGIYQAGFGTATNTGGGRFVTEWTDPINLIPGSGPSDNPFGITVTTPGTGLIALQPPETITVKTSLKPQVGSAILNSGKFYTILDVNGDINTGTWSVEFTPPVISINDQAQVDFHDISNISTGGLALEYVGSGVTYNALPRYGGVPDTDKQVVDKIKDKESTPVSQICNPGVVYYVTIDNTGNFKIGPYFAVNFIDGTIKVGAKISLSNLISIGPFRRNGIAVGTLANEISDDPTLTHTNKNYDHTTLPTQYAVRTYIEKQITSNVMPNSSNLYFVGSSTKKWRYVYSGNVNSDFATITSAGITTGNITTINTVYANFGTNVIPSYITSYGVVTINGSTTFNKNSGSGLTTFNTDAVMNGNLLINGDNLTVSGNIFAVDRVLDIGTSVNNAVLLSDDGLDRGVMLHYWNTDSTKGTVGDNHAFLGIRKSTSNLVYINNLSPGVTTVPNPISIPTANGARWGNVEVGSTTVRGGLYVTGPASLVGGVTGGIDVTGTSIIRGDLNVTGDITAFFSSDERLKENVTAIPDALVKVSEIGGYTFNWNELAKENGIGSDDKEAGVLAQEIEKVLPEVVTTRENGFKAVKYEKLVPLLIQAIKELSDKVDKLEKR